MNLGFPLLFGLSGESDSGGDSGLGLNYMMMSQFLAGGAQGNEEMSRQLQRMMMAPIARKFSERLAQKILSLSNEGRARLLASLVTDIIARRQEGDVASMLDMCAMSGVMALLNGQTDIVIPQPVEKPSQTQLGRIGGTFKGLIRSPIEEVKQLPIPETAQQTPPEREVKRVRGRL